ncbi:MAG: DNA translocase FtsK 4TM domain-containing protein [Bacillota bacterium]
MAERRVRARAAKAPQAGAQGPGLHQEIRGLLVAALGVWFLLSLAGKSSGLLGGPLSYGLRALAGEIGAWVLSAALVWFGLYLIYLRFHRRPFQWGRRSWGLLLLFLSFELLVQLWVEGGKPGGGYFENAKQGIGGGLTGLALAVPLTRVFGEAGRWVVLVTAALVGLVLNTDWTLGALINWIKERMVSGAQGAKGAAGEFYEMVRTRPGREADLEAGGTEPRRPRLAATEELNTLGELKRPAVKAAPEPAVKPGPVIKAAEPEPPAPVIRRAEPAPPAEERPADLAAKASRSVQSATDKAARKGEEVQPVPLVAGAKGQLAIDPEKLGSAYQLPSLNMLPKPQPRPGQASHQDHLARAQLLERTLKTFGVEARVVEISPGPAVTRYELQPGEGVRVNKFTNLADDLALALAAEDIRIEAPIPGKAAVGIEVPNKERLSVHIREVLETPAFLNAASKLSVAFGKDQAGNPVIGDLTRMPHLLIAGSTGSGKSVCMNTIICSLLFKARPDEVKMMMIDPKMVELSTYNGIPHLMAPVITDVKKAAGYLKGAVKEMENRYELFAASGARNIQQYNQLCLDDPGPDPEHPRKPLPYIVIFVDELADLMMVAPVDVEDSICRLAQMARACGMHLVIATQSPRVDVITGLIKANIPSRIAFAVSSQVDSRVIMDYAGAERLLGRGDMLYHPAGHSKAVRVQGAFIHEKEIDQIVTFVKQQAKPVFTAQEVAVDLSAKKNGNGGGSGADGDAANSAVDAVFPQACRIVVEHGQASVSILQRRLRCNYTKAARLIDMMEERGYIGPHQGSKPRDVLLTMPQWTELFKDAIAEGEVASGEEE